MVAATTVYVLICLCVCVYMALLFIIVGSPPISSACTDSVVIKRASGDHNEFSLQLFLPHSRIYHHECAHTNCLASYWAAAGGAAWADADADGGGRNRRRRRHIMKSARVHDLDLWAIA